MALKLTIHQVMARFVKMSVVLAVMALLGCGGSGITAARPGALDKSSPPGIEAAQASALDKGPPHAPKQEPVSEPCTSQAEAMRPRCLVNKPLRERLSLLGDRMMGEIFCRGTSSVGGQEEIDEVMISVLKDLAALPDTRGTTYYDEQKIVPVLQRFSARAPCGDTSPFILHNMSRELDMAAFYHLPGPYVCYNGDGIFKIFKRLRLIASWDKSSQCRGSVKYQWGTAFVGAGGGEAYIFDGRFWRAFDGNNWTTVPVHP